MIRRRDLLKGTGALGLSLGLLGHNRLARADTTEAPKRLLVISHCHGWPYDSWKIRPEGLSDQNPFSLDLSAMSAEEFSAPLQPLHAHRSRLLALDGFSLATAELDTDGNRHDTGWVHSWTGNWANFSGTDTRSTSPSLDQLVASAIAREDRLPSLELSVDWSNEAGRPIAYGPSGDRLPVANTLSMAASRLFGMASGGDPLVVRQRDVLDFAQAEFEAMNGQLARHQQLRLEAHAELMSKLRGRIEGLANLDCPDMATLEEATSYDERFDGFSELVAAAFACDITRVVTLSLGEMPTSDFGWGDYTDDVHKGLAHGIYDNPDKHQAMTDYIQRHAQQVARLVSLLESTPDVDGRSVMDNTLIVWGSELANGWHGYQHYCPVLIGGSWFFEPGRYLYWPHETPSQILVPASIDPSGYSATAGIPHQRLLVSVAQAMGLETDQVGIGHVQSQSGEFVECRGLLEELVL